MIEFNPRLKELNDSLWVDYRVARPIDGVPDRQILSIYCARTRCESVKTNTDGLDAQGIKWLRDAESGRLHECVTGCTPNWIPEFDEFSWTGSRLVLSSRGWRGIGKILVARKLCTKDRFREVFGCGSFLESDYDWLSYEAREALALKNLEKATGVHRRVMWMRAMPLRVGPLGLEW